MGIHITGHARNNTSDNSRSSIYRHYTFSNNCRPTQWRLI